MLERWRNLGILLFGLAACQPAMNVSESEEVQALIAFEEQKEKSQQASCDLPAAQSNSLLGKWKKLPIPLYFPTGHWDEEERSEIHRAAATWNELLGRTVFELELEESDEEIGTVSGLDCAEPIVDEDGNFTNGIPILKISQGWSEANSGSAFKLSFCLAERIVQTVELDQLIHGRLIFNYQNFFVPPARIPDLQTVSARALGGLLGLKGSCEIAPTDASGMPNCSDPDLPAEFEEAVMYPVMNFPDGLYGEVNRIPNENDISRAHCLLE